MNVSKLNESVIDIFTSKHNNILPKRKKGFEKKYFVSNTYKNDDIEIELILSKCKEVLDSFDKMDYDISKWYLEFQQRNCGFEKKAERTFDWHVDDYSTVSYKVYTIIFYLRKDITIKGGNLEYKLKKTRYTQKIEGGDILCFDGNIKHRPEICDGMGCRDIIVVFIKRKLW